MPLRVALIFSSQVELKYDGFRKPESRFYLAPGEGNDQQLSRVRTFTIREYLES